MITDKACSPAPVKCAVAGVSGYTGIEALRLLEAHPVFTPALLIGNSAAGKDMSEIYGHIPAGRFPKVITAEEADYSDISFVFACLPHAASQRYIASLPAHVKVIDLSADFRLADTALYEKVYGAPHAAPALQKEAVYGLSEFARDAVKDARIVACPGCYPTASTLPLLPLLEQGLIKKENIIIDAKSGISGAGRAEKRNTLYAETDGAFYAYNTAGHRHAPEMVQTLNKVCGGGASLQFTPHIVPMTRGILASIYVDAQNGAGAEDMRAALAARFAEEPFTHVTPAGQTPSVKYVARTNNCLIGVSATGLPGKILLISVIDNLIKGASGQAVQNANIMAGLDEKTGLPVTAFYP